VNVVAVPSRTKVSKKFVTSKICAVFASHIGGNISKVVLALKFLH